eukprot:TRINITY_DN49484_c0_g1_i1.p4 TRINITY_DN49484_c0_g1~~TRINITY_DN49484_c0_g1_i1.p4  ORF type:complete len:118 (+),score=2.41 TRINITY_DN49484_c0_g1_i1:574-927(+)
MGGRFSSLPQHSADIVKGRPETIPSLSMPAAGPPSASAIAAAPPTAASSSGTEAVDADATHGRLQVGCYFHHSDSNVWAQHPHASGARFNPPRETLSLPFELYGQPFFRGFEWEKKV